MHGLTGSSFSTDSAELNGLTGKLQSFQAPAGRWTVELVYYTDCEGVDHSYTRAIKPENLRVTDVRPEMTTVLLDSGD